MLVLFSFATSGFVFASNEEPPAPITVIEEIEPNKDALRAASDGVVPGPNGEKMTIVNRYFPYHLGAVKTDGWAEANFRQPGLSWITCKSKGYNDRGQDSGWKETHGPFGGTSCGPTPKATIALALKPATYTSVTQAFWKWSTGEETSGEARQTHYEP